MPKLPEEYETLEKRTISLTDLTTSQHYEYVVLKLLAFRAKRQYISAVEALYVVKYYTT